jgi:hypothetical protein
MSALPDISNNVGPVKLFLSALLRSLPRVVSVVPVRLLHRRPRLVCFSLTVVQLQFPTLTSRFHEKCDLLKARVVIYAH